MIIAVIVHFNCVWVIFNDKTNPQVVSAAFPALPITQTRIGEARDMHANVSWRALFERNMNDPIRFGHMDFVPRKVALSF